MTFATITPRQRIPRPQTAPIRRPAHALLALTLSITGALAPALAPTPAAEPRWRAPLDGPMRIIRPFAPPAFPWLSGHRGVDLAAEPGTPVKAAGAGKIGYAGDVGGRGVVTVLHERGLRTTYLPVRPLMRRGTPVRPGDVIGLLEPSPGHCPATCLHWGLLRDHQYLNPLLLLGRAQVRLLPFWQTPFASPALPPTRSFAAPPASTLSPA
jgi:murein DD-endopeptidase MepM/ murein hydrolase activator NlpD